ncbi:hypothetical protein [Rhodoferax sp. WC2427]|uniref:hypothetical protein n=1 Tax=Rhodoferax sp. WC2427 TaxID=3234144 RepID=UPI0034677135
MKRFFQICMSTAACVVLFGCAHPISMTPDSKVIPTANATTVIPKKVGFYISDASKALEITSPGGGGDKIRYFPYRDLETGLYQALSAAFSDVSKIKDPKDIAAWKANGVSLLITPEITTTSSSPSPFTWPPTQFGIQLTCAITDVDGKTLETVRVQGEGRAEYEDFKSNFSLSAVRASNDALAKLVTALGESKALRQ